MFQQSEQFVTLDGSFRQIIGTLEDGTQQAFVSHWFCWCMVWSTWKKFLWSSILSSYGTCDHILQLLDWQRGDRDGLLHLIFLQHSFSFIVSFDKRSFALLKSFTSSHLVSQTCDFLVSFLHNLHQEANFSLHLRHGSLNCYISHYDRHYIRVCFLLWLARGRIRIFIQMIFLDDNPSFRRPHQLLKNALRDVRTLILLLSDSLRTTSGDGLCVNVTCSKRFGCNLL